MATRRRPAARTTHRSRRSRTIHLIDLRISPETARSLLGILLLVTGAVTLIALLFPGEGILNRYVADLLRPAFGQGAWLLPILMLIAGIFVERAPSVGTGWGVTAIGGLVTFLGALGLLHLLGGDGGGADALRSAGGWLGERIASALAALVSVPGAFVVLLGILVAGILLLFNLTVRSLLRPFLAAWHGLTAVLTAPATGGGSRGRSGDENGRRAPQKKDARSAAERRRDEDDGEEEARDRAQSGSEENGAEEPDLPTPLPSPAPLSQTVWAGARERSEAPPGPEPEVSSERVAVGPGRPGEEAELLQAEDAPPPLHDRPWILPTLDLLDEPAAPPSGRGLDHERNVRIIEEKLRSFQIPATVTGANTGPVVTQYEVRPDARVKLSRIEGLADDLAMALAARSIRIEAPIPGKDVVGIEIPNHASEIVAFRELLDDARMSDATSKLTFGLGRDVSGKAYAVDLAKMPHLLVAGATGSGKSVCVNALITSLLMRARPDEVRLILVDLKRVELAAYDGLPHLLTNVIVEAGDAKAALYWAVAQMEERYKALAARAERNITAYNASARVAPHERLPYIVLVIDELADLIMREGRKVEDPVVKIAQKARAVGIHLVLATQRPSVNVVTGLIKANVPSRIAFAMSSNVDSRTVLDQPGAEDLIGRGDMLYQPADLPRPIRVQGVFVSDREVHAVCEHWREQAPAPEYDPEVVSYSDGENGAGGQFAWLAGLAEDDMTPRAAELIIQTGKASTSMLQTKLKVGFNRASRLMEELERVGVVGPQDPRNPAVPRQVYGPDNWVRGPQDVDEPVY